MVADEQTRFMSKEYTLSRTPDDNRRMPEHGYTISSPCVPYYSGELKFIRVGITTFKIFILGLYCLKLCFCFVLILV